MSSEEKPLLVVNSGLADDRKGRKTYLIFGTCGSLLLVFAFVSGFAALFAHYGINYLIDKGIRKQIVLDPEINSKFDSWQTNIGSEVAQYENLTLFNLTNPYDVVYKGAKPIYQELGPYVYRDYHTRFNLSWSKDRDVIYFREQDYYIFQRNLTDPSLSEDDIIYNLNPSYLGAVMTVGNETMLMKNMAGGALQQIMEQLNTNLLPQVIGGYRTALLFAHYMDILGSNTTENQFFSIWSDAFTPPNGLYKAMLLSEGHTTPAGISPESAALLWNMSQPNSLIYLSLTAPQDAIILWLGTCNNVTENITWVLDTFMLTPPQLERICNWFPVFDQAFVIPYIHQQHPDLEDLNDIGWLQWGQGKGTPFANSVVDNGQDLPGYPEIYFFASYVYKKGDIKDQTFGITKSKYVLQYGPMPLFDPSNVVYYLSLYDNNDFATILSVWDLDQSHATVLGEYLYYIMRTFVNSTLITQVFANDIGIISKRTVNQWVFNYTDPLLILLQQPERAKAGSLMVNQTTQDDVYNTMGINSMYTGRYNISLVSQFIEYNGTSTLTCWREPTHVTGTLGENFSPHLGKNESITIWFPQVLRKQVFWPLKQVIVQGITLTRYMLAPFMILPNPVHYNEWHAIANMTQLGAPVFISKPHFYASEPYWLTKLDGILAPDFERDETFLDVEPTTGISMRERKRVQINLYVPNDTLWFDVYFPNTQNGTLYPLLAVDENSEITPDLAAEFRDSIYRAKAIQLYGLWTAVALSGASVILSAVMFLLCMVRRRQYYSRSYRK